MHILLAEDNLKLGKLLKGLLEEEDYQVDWALDGGQAYEYTQFHTYDLLILDWMMPQKNGIEICKQVRHEGYEGGIVMLTARDQVMDRVQGLDAGADDYLIKPFEFEELLARLHALSRRSNKKMQASVVQVGGAQLDRIQKKITTGEIEVQLSPREYEILDLLIQNKNNVVPRELLIDRIWGWEVEISSNSIDSYIKKIRKKLAPHLMDVKIETVWGIGYRLEETSV